MLTQDTAVKRRHGRKLEVTVERAPHVPRRFFVIDCACGRQSPLCPSQERAVKAYDAHRKRKQVSLSS